MRLAIADPPYLGRARRWYGDGRGQQGGRLRADQHAEAATWDEPNTHVALVELLVEHYDGWAIAAAPDSLPVYLAAVPRETRVMVWHRRNAAPSGARVSSSWEAVLVWIPEGRRSRLFGQHVSDVLDFPHERRGFAGRKPATWTRWVLAALGYSPVEDELADLFPGSGAVADAADGLLL